MSASSLKISVVSPSYNQAQFLETTLCSVLDQKYPNLEYIVMDGGSNDGSADIIRRYAQHLTYWVSEKDRGQSDAINKGFAKTTGDIMCWLNSDDFFVPGTLEFVADFFQDNPDVDVLCGGVNTVDSEGKVTGTNRGFYGGARQLAQYWDGYHMHQPSIFWRRRVYERLGPLDENLHLTMDFDYWLRMSRHFKIQSVDRVLSSATIHPDQKTSNYVGYLFAQRSTVIRHYGSPLAWRDWGIRLMLYRHLLETAIRKMLRRWTIYG